MKIELSEFEISELHKTKMSDRGKGGFQSLMVSLQCRLKGSELTLTPDDIEKIVRYYNYDQGGYESRLNKIFGRHIILSNENDQTAGRPAPRNAYRGEQKPLW